MPKFFIIGIFLTVMFGLFGLFGSSKPALAVDGVMNGKTITGETDDFLFWLQTYDPTIAPYFFDKFFINKTGNVGIGTTSPIATLDINGLAKMRNYSITLPEDITNKSYVDSAIATATGTITLWGGTTGGKIWSLNSGNVGIGTTNPYSKLNIMSTSPASSTYPLFLTNSDDSAETRVGIKFIPSASGSSGSRYSAVEGIQEGGNLIGLGFITGAAGTITEKMRITSSGNIGIGTTSPSSKLDVVGNINTTGELRMFNGSIALSAPSASELRINAGGFSTVTVPNGAFKVRAGALYVSTGNNVGINTTTPAVTLDINGLAKMRNYSITLPEDITNKSYVDSAIATATGTITLWGGTTGGNIWSLNSGNVGIGTTAPIEGKLVINPIEGNSNTGITLYTGSGYTARSWLGVGGAWLFTRGSTVTNGLAIDNYGNVGIGTTNPGDKLEVNGDIGIMNSNKLIFASQLTNPSYIKGRWIDNNNSGIDFHVFNASVDTTSLSLRESGNIGINTTTPVTTLDINGLAKMRNYSITLPEDITNKSYVDSAVSSAVYTATSAITMWGGTTTGAIYSLNSGNVGIGTTNPIYGKLQITDSGTYADGLALYAGSGNIATSYLKSDGVSDFNWHLTRGGSDTLGIVIKANGNVGVGTTSPLYKFQVYNGINEAIYASGGRIVGLNTIPLNDSEAVSRKYLHDNFAPLVGPAGLWATSTTGMYNVGLGNVGIGTTTPAANLHVFGNAIISTTLTMGGDINMGAQNITNLNKLTVNTIDPLYNIKGINYATFAAAIVGGVKEEYVGSIKITKRVLATNQDDNREYEAIIDFSEVKEGSDLWVWRKIIDFSPDNVQVLLTPSGRFAEVYYNIEGNRLVFRSDRPVAVSYRLVGKRLDWREWPTRAKDQQEKAGFSID